MTITLANPRVEVQISPERGASLERLRIDGRPILREGPGLPDPRAAGSFPLAPFCNRLTGGAIRCGDEIIPIPQTIGSVEVAVHGYAWLAPWSPTRQSRTRLVLEQSAPACWPWPYQLRQVISLERTSLTLELSLTSQASTLAPVGLGFHPYFRVAPGSGLMTSARSVVAFRPLAPASEALLLQGSPTPVDGLIGADACLEGWSGTALLLTDGAQVRIEAKGCRRLQVHGPAGGEMLCLEPVMNRPNQAGFGSVGLNWIAPGASRSLSVTIGLDP